MGFINWVVGLGKVLFAILCLAVEFLMVTILGDFIFDSLFWGVVIACLTTSVFVKWFLVSVPEVTGLVTINLLTGRLATYGTGIHFRFPWEQVKLGNYINLRVITKEIKETYPAQDGPLMLVRWSFQYRPHLGSLGLYIASSDDTIKEGLADVGSSILSSLVGENDSDYCKAHQEELEEKLTEEFEGLKPTPAELYGIELIRTSLADVDFEVEVQAAKAAQSVAKIIKGIAQGFKDDLGVDGNEALNNAMVINGKSTKQTNDIRIQGLPEVLAAFLSKWGGSK